jgi:THO complex subunit 3
VSRHKQPVQTNQVIYSWSGRELFLTCGNGAVKILDLETMEPIHTLRAHTSSCYSLELSPDGRRLAIGGTDALLTLWDTWDWQCRRSLGRATGPVRTLSFSWCGGYVAAGSEDDFGVDIAHVDSGLYVHTVDTSPAAAPIVAWSPRDYSLAYSANEPTGGLRIVNGASLV